MKYAILGSILLAGLCLPLVARDGEAVSALSNVLPCGTSSNPVTLPAGTEFELGVYDTRDDAVAALESEEGGQAIGDGLAAQALTGISCSECEYTETGTCPAEVQCWGWEDGSVTTHVRENPATGDWTAYVVLENDIDFALTCLECLPGGGGGG